MRCYWISLALAGLTLVVSCISQAPKTDHQHEDLEAHLLELNTVVIAPPDITIMRQHIGRKKTVFEQRERELQGLVADIAQRELEQAGYDIVVFDFDAAIKQDPAFAETVRQFKERYDAAASQAIPTMPAPPAPYDPIRLKALYAALGRAAMATAAKSGADAVLLVRYVGFEKTDARISAEVTLTVFTSLLLNPVVPVTSSSAGTLDAALVDGRSGDLLWIDTQAGETPEQLATTVLSTLPQDIDPLQPLRWTSALPTSALLEPEGGEAATPLEQLVELSLASGEPSRVTDAALLVSSRYMEHPTLLDATYRSLLQNCDRADSDPIWVVPLEQLMKVLADSGNKHYYTALERIATTTVNRQLAQSARHYASRLLNPIEPSAHEVIP